MTKRITTVLVIGILLSACGTTPADRTISGASIGAGAGAILGAVTGLSVLEGAALGATGGALTGVLTDKNQINLGEPAWKQGKNQSPNQTDANKDSFANRDSLVTDIQKGLQNLGYNPGPVDGIYGWRTQRAIRDYQKAHGLIVDGQATPSLKTHIEQNISLINYKMWS